MCLRLVEAVQLSYRRLLHAGGDQRPIDRDDPEIAKPSKVPDGIFDMETSNKGQGGGTMREACS